MPIDINDLFSMEGTATKLADGRIRIVPKEKNQLGSLYLKTDSIDMDQNFYIKFDIDTGTKVFSDTQLAEGIGVCFHRDTDNIGFPGHGLGILGLTKGVGFEFDMYNSPEEEDPDFLHTTMYSPHITCVATKKKPNYLNAIASPKIFKPNLEEDKYGRTLHRYIGEATISWDAKTRIMKLIFTQKPDLQNSKPRITEIKYDDSAKKLIDKDSLYKFLIAGSTGKYYTDEYIRLKELSYVSNDSGNIEVRFIDKNTGKEIQERIVQTAPGGTDYDATKTIYDIPGYEYKGVSDKSAPIIGKIIKGKTQIIIYEYGLSGEFDPDDPASKIGQVTISKEDIDNAANSIEGPIVLKGKAGEPYTTNSYRGLSGPLKDKYEYVGVKPGSATESGVFEARADKRVIYQYKLKASIPEEEYGKVIVRFVTKGIPDERFQDFELVGNIGMRYNARGMIPKIKGYKVVLLSGQEEGIYSESTQEVVYEYSKERGNLLDTGITRNELYLLSLIGLILLILLKRISEV